MSDRVIKPLRDRLALIWMVAAVVMPLAMHQRAVAAPTFADGVSQGLVNTVEIDEASGLAASRNNVDVLWTHNDKGDTPRIFALDAQARLLGIYNLTGFGFVDYEDIAVGPGPDATLSYLYVGDIGDNDEDRSNITIYRIPEPAVYGSQHLSPVTRSLQGITEITINYPDGSHNAESLMIDPITGDMFIGTKQNQTSDIYHATAAQLASGLPVMLSLVASVDISKATGGDISATGGEITIRRKQTALLWTRAQGQSIVDALGGTPINLPLENEVQGEAIAFDAIGLNYYTTSEDTEQPLFLYERTSNDGPVVPVALKLAGSPWKYLDDGSDQDTAWRDAGFVDDTWLTGDGQLGYGDGDEQTIVSFGGDPNNKHATTYFRSTFDVDNAADVLALTLKLVYDDGVAVYVNGTEVQRANLAGSAAFDDLADSDRLALEDAWATFTIDESLLFTGTNQLAVEIHQFQADDPDISFDLQLISTPRGLIAGDVNMDGQISGDGTGDPANDDVAAFQAGWQHQQSVGNLDSWLLGDVNQDGITNLADWAVFSQAFIDAGAAAPLMTTSVPEPAALALYMISGLIMITHRPRR